MRRVLKETMGKKYIRETSLSLLTTENVPLKDRQVFKQLFYYHSAVKFICLRLKKHCLFSEQELNTNILNCKDMYKNLSHNSLENISKIIDT